MTFALPLVVPKSRAVNLGGMAGVRTTLTSEINAQSLADLHSILVGITREESANQERLGNPAQLVEVDNRTNKPLDQVKAKTVVLFGVALAAAAMRMVETELRQAISRSTRIRTGTLLDIGGAWEWRFIPRGGVARVVSSASPPPAFQRGDRLVLVPVHVPYATAVNRAVANGGRLNAHNAPKRGRNPRAARSAQNLGFLATATRAVKRRSEFRQFAVVAEFTRAHAVPGEVYRHGTGVITIRPRFRRVRA